MSPKDVKYSKNKTTVNRCISTKSINNYTMVKSSLREDAQTPIFSLKSTTANAISGASDDSQNARGGKIISFDNKENSHSIFQTKILEKRRLLAGTPTLQETKLNPNIITKKRSGSGEKNSSKILHKFMVSKVSTKKGRNNVKIGMSSTTSLHKGSTIEIKKRNLFKQLNIRNSPKYLQEPRLKVAKKKI